MTAATNAPLLNGGAIPKMTHAEAVDEINWLIKRTKCEDYIGFRTISVGVKNFNKVKSQVFIECNKCGQNEMLEWDMDDAQTRVEFKSRYGGITFQKTAA